MVRLPGDTLPVRGRVNEASFPAPDTRIGAAA